MARAVSDRTEPVLRAAGAEKISPPPRALRVAPPPAERSWKPPVERLSTPRLMGEIARKTKLLAKKEAELAKAEARADLIAQLELAKRLAGAALAALFGIGMLLVAAAFALSALMPGWLAALSLAVLLLLAAGLAFRAGWSRRTRSLLSATRRTIRDAVAAVRRVL